jgi:hypothetical protein
MRMGLAGLEILENNRVGASGREEEREQRKLEGYKENGEARAESKVDRQWPCGDLRTVHRILKSGT